MEDEKRVLKMAVIAGASHALKYKEKHWKAESSEVLQHINENMSEIIDKIDNPF
jgi:hypothetical protein